MLVRLAIIAGLGLLALHVEAAEGAATLLVSATVVRSVHVTTAFLAAGNRIEVRTSSGSVWSAPLHEAANLPGGSVSPYAPDPRCVVVTVHADAVPAGAPLALR